MIAQLAHIRARETAPKSLERQGRRLRHRHQARRPDPASGGFQALDGVRSGSVARGSVMRPGQARSSKPGRAEPGAGVRRRERAR